MSDKDGKDDSNRKMKDDKSKRNDKGDEEKNGEKVKKNGRQQALNIANSTLSTTQDSMSKVDATSSDSIKSNPMVFATVLPLKSSSTHIRKSHVYHHKLTENGASQWTKGQSIKLLSSDTIPKLNVSYAKKISHVKHMMCKTTARRPRKKNRTTTMAIINVVRIDLPHWDEDYDKDALEFMGAQ